MNGIYERLSVLNKHVFLPTWHGHQGTQRYLYNASTETIMFSYLEASIKVGFSPIYLGWFNIYLITIVMILKALPPKTQQAHALCSTLLIVQV